MYELNNTILRVGVNSPCIKNYHSLKSYNLLARRCGRRGGTDQRDARLSRYPENAQNKRCPSGSASTTASAD